MFANIMFPEAFSEEFEEAGRVLAEEAERDERIEKSVSGWMSFGFDAEQARAFAEEEEAERVEITTEELLASFGA